MCTKSKVEESTIIVQTEHDFIDRSVCDRAKEEHSLGFRFLKHVYLYSLERNSGNIKDKEQN